MVKLNEIFIARRDITVDELVTFLKLLRKIADAGAFEVLEDELSSVEESLSSINVEFGEGYYILGQSVRDMLFPDIYLLVSKEGKRYFKSVIDLLIDKLNRLKKQIVKMTAYKRNGF